MAKCNLRVPFSGPPENLFKAVSRLATDNGGTISGDAYGGSFVAGTPVGDIAGTYRTEGNIALIAITKKPLIASCSRIEKEVLKFVQQQAPPTAAETRRAEEFLNNRCKTAQGCPPPTPPKKTSGWWLVAIAAASVVGVILARSV
jgi:hypothetical protein